MHPGPTEVSYLSKNLMENIFLSPSLSLSLCPFLCVHLSCSRPVSVYALVCLYMNLPCFFSGRPPLSMTPGTTPCCPNVHSTRPHQGLYVSSIPTLSRWGPLPLFFLSLPLLDPCQDCSAPLSAPGAHSLPHSGALRTVCGGEADPSTPYHHPHLCRYSHHRQHLQQSTSSSSCSSLGSPPAPDTGAWIESLSANPTPLLGPDMGARMRVAAACCIGDIL